MNAAASFANVPAATIPQRPGRGAAAALGLSLLVHAALVAWMAHVWLQALAPRPPAVRLPGKRIEVRLAPPAPRPAPQTTPPPSSAPLPARAHATPGAAHAPARTPAYATVPAPAHETPDTIDAAPADSPAAAAAAAPAPAVDIAAARQAARLIAREGGKATVRLPERKPVTDPNSGKPEAVDPIEAARRKDCKSAYAGAGILALIPLAVDAVRSAVDDSGCKW